MVTANSESLESFLHNLRQSNVVSRGQLDQVVDDFLARTPDADVELVAKYLVGLKLLTRFQADHLIQNRPVPLVLGPYTLLDEAGFGSMGTVFKARHQADKQWFAIKVLPRRSMWNVRLARRQVRSFLQIQHPTVVPFTDVGTAGGVHYLAWPLVEGQSLEKVLRREKTLPPVRAAYYAQQVAAGLSACEAREVFHGLIKPSNVMIGPKHDVHILDFGIGSLLVENKDEDSMIATQASTSSLTSGLDWAAPETVTDPTNRTSLGDQYSLGCVLYYCLTGRVPFPDETVAGKLRAIQLEQPTPVRKLAPLVPPELAEIVERLMEKSPESRYGTMREVSDTLELFIQSADPAEMSFKQDETISTSSSDSILLRSGDKSSVNLQLPTRQSMNIQHPKPPPQAPEAAAEEAPPPEQSGLEMTLPQMAVISFVVVGIVLLILSFLGYFP